MRLAVSCALLLLSGCTVHHLETNAPGHVDVLQPPEHLDARGVDPPADPGERMVSLTYGVLAGGGLAFPKGSDAVGAYGVGPEVSLHVGSSPHSHDDDSPPVLPARALGVNVGWTALSHPGQSVGPLYGELQWTEMPYYLAGGWAWDADESLHGPQATLGIGVLYLRYTHLFDQGGALQAGLVFKGYDTWVWSQ